MNGEQTTHHCSQVTELQKDDRSVEVDAGQILKVLPRDDGRNVAGV